MLESCGIVFMGFCAVVFVLFLLMAIFCFFKMRKMKAGGFGCCMPTHHEADKIKRTDLE